MYPGWINFRLRMAFVNLQYKVALLVSTRRQKYRSTELLLREMRQHPLVVTNETPNPWNETVAISIGIDCLVAWVSKVLRYVLNYIRWKFWMRSSMRYERRQPTTNSRERERSVNATSWISRRPNYLVGCFIRSWFWL